MLKFALIFIIAGVLAWLATWLTTKNATALGLVHLPNARSSHTKITPHGGGIGVVISVLFVYLALLIGSGEANWTYWASFVLALIIATIGLIDDIHHLSAKLRLLIQIAAIALLVWMTLPIQTSVNLPMIGQWLLFPVIVLTGVWWLNLFNFMDGIDGIAGSQGIYMLSAAMLLMSLTNTDVMASDLWLWMLAFVAAMLGFLLHNWSPARIFMGDVGSNFIAFMMLFFALVSLAKGWLSLTSWAILAAVFVADASVTLIRRALSQQNVLQAHRSHAYQRLSRQWQSHARVTLAVLAINVGWLLPLAYAANNTTGLFAWGLLSIAYLPVLLLAYYLDAGKQAE